MIRTEYVYPPIPLRQYDWAAYEDDETRCPACRQTVGYGETELDAIIDLLAQQIIEEEQMG